jgi:hypothetical protein
MSLLAKPKLLILDETGYLALDFFQTASSNWSQNATRRDRSS